MVQLIPAKQCGPDGRMLEANFRSLNENLDTFLNFTHNLFYVFIQIMTPKARVDVHLNLPALQKLDSMLLVGDLFAPVKVN